METRNVNEILINNIKLLNRLETYVHCAIHSLDIVICGSGLKSKCPITYQDIKTKKITIMTNYYYDLSYPMETKHCNSAPGFSLVREVKTGDKGCCGLYKGCLSLN